ncbi:hypothetical protein EDB84DRAFT_1440994 [Lactarius hengduanensis]|nr:hypothetical protein EDB84DRAFT_1440994 [Lactarius hengduanensis]
MASRTSARTTLQRPALAFAPHGDYLSSQRRVALPPRRRTRQPASLLQPEPVTLYYHATSIHFRSVRLGFRSPRRQSHLPCVEHPARVPFENNEGQKGSALAGPATAPTPADALANTSLLAESYESLKAENTECARTPRSRGKAGDGFPEGSRSNAGSARAAAAGSSSSSSLFDAASSSVSVRVPNIPSIRAVVPPNMTRTTPTSTVVRSVYAFIPWRPAGPDEHHLVCVWEVLAALSGRVLREKADRFSERERRHRSA